MRPHLLHIPSVVLATIPLFVAALGISIRTTSFILALWLLLRIVVVVYVAQTCERDRRVILVSLPFSHYVEKVRWCLDRRSVRYQEECNVGILWRILLGRPASEEVPSLVVPGLQTTVCGSSNILRYLYGMTCGEGIDSDFLRPVTDEHSALDTKIEQLGEDLRQYFYYHTLVLSPIGGNKCALKLWGINHSRVPYWQKILLIVLFPLIKRYLFWILQINEQAAVRGLRSSKEFFLEMETLLSDGRKYILDTKSPTYVDFSLAAMAALLAFPDNYGGSGLEEGSRPHPKDCSPEMQEEIRKFRRSPLGLYVLRLYNEYR